MYLMWNRYKNSQRPFFFAPKKVFPFLPLFYFLWFYNTPKAIRNFFPSTPSILFVNFLTPKSISGFVDPPTKKSQVIELLMNSKCKKLNNKLSEKVLKVHIVTAFLKFLRSVFSQFKCFTVDFKMLNWGWLVESGQTLCLKQWIKK